jgi:NADH-quinone oxidoreductase subunit N
MKLTDVLSLLVPDLNRSLIGLAPEITLVITIVLMLVVRLFQRSVRWNASGLALAGTVLALVISVLEMFNIEGIAARTSAESSASASAPMYRAYAYLANWVRTSPPRIPLDEPKDLFSGAVPLERGDVIEAAPKGMVRFDGFTVFFRMFLCGFAALTIWLTRLTGIPDNEDSPDFYVLLLGATIGMSLMASANHLLMVYIAVEMASLPSYAMAGFLKGRRDASEASLKYVVYGAGASGIMLYGISLLIGRFGTAHVPSLALEMAKTTAPLDGIVIFGILLVLAGIAFKISAVPFHFWCPDVFEGAAAEVAGFLSVASKAAALALLVRFSISLTTNSSLLRFDERPAAGLYLASAIAFLSAITATYGNLAAFAQTNLKRLLAFSTISQAGYMMMPVAAAIVLGRELTSNAEPALQSLVFYLVIYLFMNLGAFAVVALIRNQIRSEDLRDYGGLIRSCPFLTVAMAVFLLSLTGIPPLAGFAAKWNVIYVLFQAKLFWLVAVVLANTVFSAFYYVKVLRVMILDEPKNEQGEVRAWSLPRGAVAFCTLMIAANLAVMLVWGAWDAVNRLTEVAVPHLLESFPVAIQAGT